MTDNGRLNILIADDTQSDRLILEAIIKKEGHCVVSVNDGLEAVAAFETHHPDIVLLDALMPNLDGFGAARQIKALAGEELVPIIFLTSLTDTDSLVKCLEAGGDDFLSKPYNRIILQAKIKAFSRMRELNTTMVSQRDLIAEHNRAMIQEQHVAKQVFDNIAHKGCLDANNIEYLQSPLAVFNGDILVAAMRPNGSMIVLLGDFTGHGLPAAVGALPLASAFYGMVQKGFSMVDVLREINQKLNQILPIGVFCCATILDINFAQGKVKLWNGGLPNSYIYRADSDEPEAAISRHLPLGILSDAEFKADFLEFELSLGDRIYLWSDGIIESRNSAGDMYGEERLEQVFNANVSHDNVFDELQQDVQVFVEEEALDDDLSVIELTMVKPDDLGVEEQNYLHQSGAGLQDWELKFTLGPKTFKSFDPMPLLINILVEVPGLKRFSGDLYTILAELYCNALEHGVLKLDSRIKQTAEGFTQYYRAREERLGALISGSICIGLSHAPNANGGELTIYMQDSGDGFDYASLDREVDGDKYCGRGIDLIEKLCHSVVYRGGGSEVEAVFKWQL